MVSGGPFQPSLLFVGKASGLYYKPMTIINDDSRVVTKLETSLTDNARVIIYDRQMFIVQATGAYPRVERLKGLSIGQDPSLLTNIRLGWKGLPGTNNTQAYNKN